MMCSPMVTCDFPQYYLRLCHLILIDLGCTNLELYKINADSRDYILYYLKELRDMVDWTKGYRVEEEKDVPQQTITCELGFGK